MECVTKPPSGVRKVKKKQVKDELDRIKQAEKKKRRLEKALATSAAIRSELEKKKQMKKEEQQRLDEEGAAIAEAVALQVLLGEDSDESCKIMIDKSEEFNPWDCCASNFDVFLNGGTNAILPHHHSLSTSSNEEIVWVPATHYRSRCHWSNDNWTVSSGPTPYFEDEEGVWNSSEISAAGLIAAQAVSSLQIREDECVDAAAFVFNRMVRG